MEMLNRGTKDSSDPRVFRISMKKCIPRDTKVVFPDHCQSKYSIFNITTVRNPEQMLALIGCCLVQFFKIGTAYVSITILSYFAPNVS